MSRSILVSLGFAAAISAQERAVEFSRDVRPILANHCYRCHGPDASTRKAKLRLDRRDTATAPRKHGAAIVPGDPAGSLLIQRVTHADPKERMPPAAKAEPISPRQVAVLRRWIAEGAAWQAHWAFGSLQQPPVPAPSDAAGLERNDIDRLLLRRLADVGLQPAPPADPRTLIRRLYLDLVGLPPSPAQVQAYLMDPTERRYTRIVDRLLGSVHHAERLTMYWLDLVRYGDSCGIHGDQVISMSPYRDWVIQAFHANMPFDQFTREQLAGDLLPGAKLPQQVASGYNRLNMKTAEGGAQEAEYLVKYTADRVRTTAAVWLGATLGCAECHDHKFDPFTTRDFYSFGAFFADLDHRGYYPGANRSGDWGPKVLVPTPAQRAAIAAARTRIAALENEFFADSPSHDRGQQGWEQRTRAALAQKQPPRLKRWLKIGPFKAASHRAAFDSEFVPEGAATIRLGRPIGGQRWLPAPQFRDGVAHKLQGTNSATYLYREVDSPRAQDAQLSLGSDDGIKLWVNGDQVLSRFVTRGVKPGQDKPTIRLRQGRNTLLLKISQGGGGHAFYFALARSGPPPAITAILNKSTDLRSAADRKAIRGHYRGLVPELAGLRRQLATARAGLKKLEQQQTTTLVSKARKTPRITRVLRRGNWQDQSGEVVQPAPPAFLPGADVPDKRWGRLELADWLTARDNPLPARVFVNRLWKICFGRGLCATLDDLGAQGERPRQLELLDWLASEFRKDWDARRVLRLMVMSGAYRQSSTVSAVARERDPENREFARQNRFRLDAELVRDQALQVSGLLNPEVGGPSVKPYQPVGYWGQLNFPKRQWTDDTGAAQYRRGLYTHWQRTFLHPSLRAFDAPSREECTAERPRSNTPLQALALLNDPTYVEAARVLAARVLQEGGEDFPARLQWLFAQVLQRAPGPREFLTLETLHQGQRTRYTKDRAAAAALTAVGQAATMAGVDPVDHAAWTAVVRALLNLHEVITRY